MVAYATWAGFGLRRGPVDRTSVPAAASAGFGCARDRLEFVDAAACSSGDAGEWLADHVYWQSGFGMQPLGKPRRSTAPPARTMPSRPADQAMEESRPDAGSPRTTREV